MLAKLLEDATVVVGLLNQQGLRMHLSGRKTAKRTTASAKRLQAARAYEGSILLGPRAL